jgi:calcium-dependent protein kinase
MSFAHAQDLCHTNLKPENILLARHADWSELRIINFPISVGFDDNKNLNEKWQAPHFLAPELFDPKATPN